MTTTVEAMASFLEGHVTFLSSILASRRNCTVFGQKGSWIFLPEGLIALGTSFAGAADFGSERVSALPCATASLAMAGWPLFFFCAVLVRPLFFVEAGRFRFRRPIDSLFSQAVASSKPH
jgi:hypothetical protein